MTYPIICGALLIILVLVLFYTGKIILDLRRKNKELKISQQRAEQQAKLKQEFISTLSHELRTPLYGMMGLTRLIVEEHPELKSNRNLRSLKFSGDYLLSLINNILQVNYINYEELIPAKTSFNLKDTVSNLVNSFSYATENSDNTLDFKFDESIPEQLESDPAILTQILMNLISNALRFSKNGIVLFTVDTIKDDATSCTISFNIRFDGSEVSKEDEDSIYEEFTNIETEKRSYLGIGLNSTIVKSLATALDSEIIKQDSSFSGSEYAFAVTFKKASQHTEQSIAEKTVTSDKLRALVVDDNKLNLLVADKILSSENFDCTTIDNGYDAIDLVRDNSYDIILMDINMPKLNGIGTTKRIREFDQATPIIALTAVDVTQLNRQIIQAGLNDYILKPYDKNHLLELINKNIENTKS
ncbi:response regulator [Aquimarina intermedia]|uniref:histidine kinase n=1 Tax=Aquimarina intermedia TaxID=350814 RepID=A0A5S5CA61_9FLAO|nr:response regulator [Aquimarina intermedia]TYP75220.1 signal transduction histidine kinase [Aquimarina intermedia]